MGNYVLICDADHPLQLQAFMDTRWNWYPLRYLATSKTFHQGGLLLLPNLPEIVYKNAKSLGALSYHWLILDPKYSPQRLTEIAQKAGVLLHFFQYPFSTRYWSREFLEEAMQAIELQQS